MYKGEAVVDNPHLSHIVSCPVCLDQVNDILGLPPLAERYPTDMAGPDAPSARGGRGGSSGGASGGGKDLTKMLRRRTQDAFEHRPQELHIAVNGLILGSQTVHAELNEQTLEIGQPEPISFIEVFSEQETRLLMMPVGAAPPAGPAEQSARISLSDGRLLELTLSFRCPHPMLHAAYRDPLMKADLETSAEAENDLVEAFPHPLIPLEKVEQTVEFAQRSRKTSLQEAEQTRQFALLSLRNSPRFGESQQDMPKSLTADGWNSQFARLFKATPRFSPAWVTAVVMAFLLTGALMVWLRLPATPAVTAARAKG